MAEKKSSDKKQTSDHSPGADAGPILVPVDFSPHSEAALLTAADLATCFGAHLLVLHVVHDPERMPGYYARMAKKKTLARMEDVAGEMLDSFLAKLREAHPDNKELRQAESILVSGLPVTRILQLAEKRRARLVVMGSKGVTGLRHLLLGSVAEQVVHLAQMPVTIVKARSKD